MNKETKQKGYINYSDKPYESEGKLVFYLSHSCDEWIIGNLEEAKKFAQDLLDMIKEVEDENNTHKE